MLSSHKPWQPLKKSFPKTKSVQIQRCSSVSDKSHAKSQPPKTSDGSNWAQQGSPQRKDLPTVHEQKIRAANRNSKLRPCPVIITIRCCNSTTSTRQLKFDLKGANRHEQPHTLWTNVAHKTNWLIGCKWRSKRLLVKDKKLAWKWWPACLT